MNSILVDCVLKIMAVGTQPWLGMQDAVLQEVCLTNN